MMNVPIPTVHLLLPLDQKLIELLKSLSNEDWNKTTLAKLWTVKDVAAHLLDGNLRTLALSQNHTGEPHEKIQSYHDLVDYLNRLNADWVKAMKRVSPYTIIELLEATQQSVIDYYHSLDLWAPAPYPVSWAGEVESKNWFNIAREYTERWHHQQQIREATDRDGIMEQEFFSPLIQTFMMALPHAFHETIAPDGVVISLRVTHPLNQEWQIVSHNRQWSFASESTRSATTFVEMSGETAWKLFTKAFPENVALEKVKISGDIELGMPILKMVSVMA